MTRIIVLVIYSLFIAGCSCGFTLATPSVASPKFVRTSLSPAMQFMREYGYLQKGIAGSEALYQEDAIVQAIKNVQKFGNIPETGEWDNATQKLVESPRCGVADIIRGDNERRKRNVPNTPGWKKRDITYLIANWSPKLGEETVASELERAFNVWSVVSRLRFKRVHGGNADIVIVFGRGPHGDWYPFDGPGMTLAHAYFPYESGNLGGDIHFDEDEPWEMQTDSSSRTGTDFFTVAVHEIGHSLGLPHSADHSSVMRPYYTGYNSYFQLAYSDILNMYNMYLLRRLEGEDTPDEVTTRRGVMTTARSTTSRSTTTTQRYHVTNEGDDESVEDHPTHDDKHRVPTAPPTVVPNICAGNFDAIAILREELFIFKGEYLWRLSKRGEVQQGYPSLFRNMFWKLPATVKKIDAVYQRHTDGSIVLFSGNSFWVYDGRNLIEGSPRPLTDYGLPSNLPKIDAVQVWKKNGMTYLYSGDKYWRYNDTTHKMDSDFPQKISVWRGVPQDLDAAMTWVDGSTYFFKGSSFWRFDNNKIRVADNYPIPAPQYWLNCPEN